jgi:hypothetical protein
LSRKAGICRGQLGRAVERLIAPNAPLALWIGGARNSPVGLTAEACFDFAADLSDARFTAATILHWLARATGARVPFSGPDFLAVDWPPDANSVGLNWFQSVIVLSLFTVPPAKASSLYARFCRGARGRQTRSLPRAGEEPALVQLRALRGAFGPLVTAPLFRLGLETGIEAAIGAGSEAKGQ